MRPADLGAPELAAWRSMQRATPGLGHPFLSPGFILAAGRARPTTRVAVLEEGPAVVGFLAFDQQRFRVGRPAAPGVSDAQAVIHAPGFDWDPVALLRGCRLDVWEFDHLIQTQLAPGGPHVVARSAPLIDVSCGYDAYLASRGRVSSKTLRSTLYKQRKLERDLGATRFALNVHDADALRLLLAWKSAQYRRTGHRDRLAIPWVAELIRDLFDAEGQGCIGTLSVLYHEERVLAAHFGLRADGMLACWFPAYDISLARYSPGLSLHLKMIEAAWSEGIHRLDLGKGDEDYKGWLKTGETAVGEGRIERRSVVAALRRVQRAPREKATHLVLSNPALRRAARRTLRRIGRLRSAG